jgi:hypothetical protein
VVPTPRRATGQELIALASSDLTARDVTQLAVDTSVFPEREAQVVGGAD